MSRLPSPTRLLAALVLTGTVAAWPAGAAELLNVSYDPTREVYRDVNEAFSRDWKEKTGETVTIRTSHGGSGAQARTVIDGVPADVVTLGIPSDIDAIARLSRRIPADWRARLPNGGLAYTSTVVFVVRKGNPKNIKDWPDLARAGVGVVTPNPKTSAGGRWNFLAAWGYGQGDAKNDSQARDFVSEIYRNVPVLDTGARGSTVSFAQRGLGDVLPTWENEAYLVLDEFGADKFDIVVPPTSVVAEPPVALVDANVDRRGTRKEAEAYLAFLYSDTAQAIFARHHYRPTKPVPGAAAPPAVALFRITDRLGDWDSIQKTYFDNGGVFDQMSRARR